MVYSICYACFSTNSTAGMSTNIKTLWSERQCPSFKGLQKLPDLQIKGGVLAPVAVEGVLRANRAALEQHFGGVNLTAKVGVVERDRVPIVTSVDVNETRVEEKPEAVDVVGVRGLKDIVVGGHLEQDGGIKIRGIKVDRQAPCRLSSIFLQSNAWMRTASLLCSRFIVTK
ncbi:hypothetical protein QYF36_016511 [Acer negundo]|nr:hypothetical protein QYF36_016511 [Acer negundo]